MDKELIKLLFRTYDIKIGHILSAAKNDIEASTSATEAQNILNSMFVEIVQLTNKVKTTSDILFTEVIGH